MKSKLLKVIAVIGMVGLFTMAGTASASEHHHSCGCGYYSHHHDYYSDYDHQAHTYHVAEYPFIW